MKIKRTKEVARRDYVRKFVHVIHDTENMRDYLTFPTVPPEEEYMYMSMFSFEFGATTTPPTVSGYIADYLVFDFDSPNGLEMARDETRMFLELLIHNYEIDSTHVRVWFSGYKGFHVQMPVNLFYNGEYLPFRDTGAIKTFTRELCGGLSTFDNSIYDNRRLIRLPGAMNPNSGLYKIALTHSDLYGPIDRIVNAARTKNGFGYEDGDVFEAWTGGHTRLEEMYMASAALSQNSPAKQVRNTLRDMFLPAKKGERNKGAAKLAWVLRSRGVDLQMAQLIAQTWNRTNEPPLEQDELARTVSNIYRNK